jgi:hypothetical protein
MNPLVLDTIKELKKEYKKTKVKISFASLLERFTAFVEVAHDFSKSIDTQQKKQHIETNMAFKLDKYITFDSADEFIAYLKK